MRHCRALCPRSSSGSFGIHREPSRCPVRWTSIWSAYRAKVCCSMESRLAIAPSHAPMRRRSWKPPPHRRTELPAPRSIRTRANRTKTIACPRSATTTRPHGGYRRRGRAADRASRRVMLSSRPIARVARSSNAFRTPPISSGGAGGKGAGMKARTVSPPATELQ